MIRIVFAAMAALVTSAALAQPAVQPPMPVPPLVDWNRIQIKTTDLGHNTYMLEGAGGNITVAVGSDGIIMVDSQFAPLSDKIKAAIKAISPLPIKYLVNTHFHGDHTGGNENFAKMGATLISREELRYRLAHPNPGANGQPAPAAPAAALPKQTYRDQLTLFMNGEEVQLVAVPRAHTDGDTMVVFPGLDVIMTGDFYRSIQYPNIDRANGGSLQGMLDGLALVIGRAGPNTKIIPGHGPTVTRAAVATHRDMILAVRDRVQKLVETNKTEDEVVAAKVLADFDSKVDQAGTTGERFVRQVYAEVKATR
jgi:glyoxylase-like metal-dependent hydrolase (beta-lactamase superfamily II)